ncbi:MAG: glycogen synthase [Candidatus Limnocylindrales bacterium]
MRVVTIAAECEPWAKTGGLGDVVDALARAVGATGQTGEEHAPTDRAAAPAARPSRKPRAPQPQVWVGTGAVMGVGQAELDAPGGVEAPVEVFLPRYRGVAVPAGATSRPLDVPDPLARSGMTEVTLVEFEDRGYRVRLIDHPPAFDRAGYYGDSTGDYADNGWRFGLLCRAAIEALLTDERPVDVLHLHDWQAMPAVLMRDCAYEGYPRISRAAVMVTIHNLAYQGWLSRAGAAGMLFQDELKHFVPPDADGILLLREGIRHAELVNTVSPGYAAEIVHPAFGMGLDPDLAALGHRFGGILNGLDTDVWNPATDSALPAVYSRADLTGKAACRRALLSKLGFDPDDPAPVLGMIGRLDPQKGFDLLAGAAPTLVAEGARVIALGTGDPKLVDDLKKLAAIHPTSVAVVEAFDRTLARRIYAGADLYVMPSRFEPCGQGQMIALRYATPPVVHRTGGLADTVVDVDERPDEGTGFVHGEATTKSLLEACRRAMKHHRDGGREWSSLQDRGMAIDWSWEAGPAEQYAASYRRAVSLRRENRDGL